MKNPSYKLLVSFVAGAAVFLAALAFSSPAKEKPQAPAKGSVTEGEALFTRNCTMCHNADSTEKKIGPGLKGLFKQKELITSHKPVTAANVREQIEKGDPSAKPIPMPPFGEKLKPSEIDSLIAYLKTI